MKDIATLLVAAAAAFAAVDARADEFLSWYDGWGTHSVWGIGKVAGSYVGTTVVCGRHTIPIRAVYDTHADSDSPTMNQQAELLRKKNLKLRTSLEKSGAKCAFALSKT